MIVLQLVKSAKEALEELYTGYFAAVMATGIVATALNLTAHPRLSKAALVVAIAIYVILLVAYFLRLLWFPGKVWRDLTSAGKVFGYFTFVAATDVLGTDFSLYGSVAVSLWLGSISLLAWLLLMYFIVMVLLFHNEQPVQNVINGSWLITTVAVESLAALGSAAAGVLADWSEVILLVSAAFWGIGIVFYAIFITLIIYRFFFFSVQSSDLTPPYWINMGAMAITTLAGSRLILDAHASSLLTSIMPLAKGFTFIVWAWGSWWIPLLILMGIWKFVVFHEKFRYDPALWSIVFPLGMYTAATDTMSKISGFGIIHWLVPWCLDVAVTAWVIVVLAFFVSALASVLHRGPT